jgi:transposase
MQQQQIRRRVAAVDTRNQGWLFAGDGADSGVASESTPSVKAAMRFNDPDPHALRINALPLEEFLKTNGQRAPLRIRQFLSTLSFVEFEAAYEPGGRPPYAPRAMVGIILSGLMQGISSLRELEQFARVNLGCWWVSGAIMPDHSILGRFIQRHDELLRTGFFDQLVQRVLKVTHTNTAVVAGDGTVIEAAASRYRLLRAEALQAALTEARAKAASEPNPRRRKRIARLEQAKEVLDARRQARKAHGKDPSTVSINPQESDAVVQPQKDQRYAASYKPSVLANTMRVILACELHASSETSVVPALLDTASQHGAIDTALFDAGYCASDILTAMRERHIELLCPEGNSRGADWNKHSDKHFPKSRFVYLADQDGYRCPHNQTLTPVSRYQGNASAPSYVEYGSSACRECPLKHNCTRSATGRTIKRYLIDTEKDALRLKMADPTVRERYKKRQAMVEPVFAQLRGVQGLRRFHRTGLAGARVEFALHALAYNVGRVLARAVFIVRASATSMIDSVLRWKKTNAKIGHRIALNAQYAVARIVRTAKLDGCRC